MPVAAVFTYPPTTLCVDHHGYPFDAGAVAVARRLACYEGVTFSAQWHTFLQRLAVGQLVSAKKQTNKCCVVPAVRLLLYRLPSANFLPFWDRFTQVALLQGLDWCSCQWIAPTHIDISEQHLIEIIYHTSSVAFCKILFALMLFMNVSEFKAPKTLCRWMKCGRETTINMFVKKLCVCHPFVNSASYYVTLLSFADLGFSALILYVGSQWWISTEQSRPYHQYTCSRSRALSFSTFKTPNYPQWIVLVLIFLSCHPKPSPPLSPSLYLFPGSQPLCCNWKQLRQGYYSADRPAFGGGPRIHTEL